MVSTVKDVLLFAGQGSNQYMSDMASVARLKSELGREAPTLDGILGRCFEALLAEYDSLTAEDRSGLGLNLNQGFETPQSLLLPPESYQSHPVIETTVLYLRQIMELLLYRKRENSGHAILTAAGVCTGVLPAVLSVSSSWHSSDGFADSIVEGFRLAFWIGVRSALFSRQISGESWRESSCVLSIFGVPIEEAQGYLSLVENQDLAYLIQTPSVSAIFSHDTFSISGTGSRLDEIQATLSARSIQFRRAQVHGYYHGGCSMNKIVQQVLDDVKRRQIRFPTWESLLASLRSTITGSYMRQTPNSQSLLKTVLHHIFVDTVDWRTTQQSLSTNLKETPDETRIVCLGPGAGSLISYADGFTTIPRVKLVDNFMHLISSPKDDAIAIVGLSANLPCGNGLEKLWDTLQKGHSTATEIPSSRFELPQNYEKYGPDGQKRPKTSTQYGNFLSDTFDFDPACFNISPREAKSMDPQQRLLLRAALEALEDAGYAPDATETFQRDSFGVYIGVATGDYVDNLRNDIDVYYSPGTLRAFLSGRISYVFGFRGPSIVVDTACSSSLVALYQACRAIQSGDCTAALAGGVNTISSPDMYTGLTRGHFLSASGQCKPFDSAADGYCRAEGCGLFVLKKLSNALAENDTVYGVIRGIGVNQCGTAISITHPDHETQAALFRQVLDSSKISPDSINVVEAHGTGTQAGDAAEVSSVATVFGVRPAENPLYISTAKGNIGHAEAASGVAGLLKLLAMMQKKQIPLQASFTQLNPRLTKMKSHNIIVPERIEDWRLVPNRTPRRAILNNFGAAGSNAALILEEHIPPTRGRRAHATHLTSQQTQHVLNLSAKSEKALEALRWKYISYIASNPDVPIESLCYSANARRLSHTAYRLSIVGQDLEQLVSRLKEARIKFRAPSEVTRTPIFVFSGQGTAHAGMGAELYHSAPAFRDAVVECDNILSRNGFSTTAAYISGDPKITWTEDQQEVVVQCATFVLEYALGQLWMAWGVKPQIVLGHSIGEYAALVIAQVLELQDALLFIARRAVLMKAKCQDNATGMLACRVSSSDALIDLEVLVQRRADIDMACRNSSQNVVVAGSMAALDAIIEHCKTKNIKTKRLPVPYGFHSFAMDPILDDLTQLAATLKFQPPPQVRFGSALYGRLFAADEQIDHDYLVRHTRETVNFSRLVNDIREHPGQQFIIIEIGPSGSMRSMFTNDVSSDTFLTSLHPSESAWVPMAKALQTMFLEGHKTQWREVYRGLPVTFLRSIPGYPLDMSQYFVPFTDSRRAGVPQDRLPSLGLSFEFLNLQTGGPRSDHAFRELTSALSSVAPFIKAHAVGGVPLCPASVYLEIALEAVTLCGKMNTDEKFAVFEDISFEKPYVLSATPDVGLQPDLKTSLDLRSSERVAFTCASQRNHIHCAGTFIRRAQRDIDEIFMRRRAFVQRQHQSFHSDSKELIDTFSSRTIYRCIFPRVVEYNDPFMTLTSLAIRPGGLEGYGTFKLSSSAVDGKFVCPPALTDTLLHTSGFMANAYAHSETACICVKIENAIIPCGQSELFLKEMSVYSSLIDVGDYIIADAYALDPHGCVIIAFEGMHFRKVKLSSFSAQLSRLAHRPEDAVAGRSRTEVLPKLSLRNSMSVDTTRARPPRLSDIESILQSCIAEICGFESSAAADRTLSELGVDSLLLIELTESICGRFSHLSLRKSDLEDCTSVAELTSVVNDALKRSNLGSSPLPGLTGDDAPGASSPMEVPTPRGDDQVSQLHNKLDNLLLDLCGLSLTDNDKSISLGSLGVDSLLSIELVQEIQARFNIDIDEVSHTLSDLTYVHLESLLSQKPAIMDLNEIHSLSTGSDVETDHVLDAMKSTGEAGCAKLLQRQRNGATKSALYLFHDGSGLTTMYSRLIDMDRDVYGISSSDIWTSRAKVEPRIDTMEGLAALYIERANLVAQSDIILGGWSFGGVLAFEVSRQLRRLGKAVKGVILIDSPLPVNHQALPTEVISFISSKALSKTPIATEAAKQARSKVEMQFKYHGELLENYAPPTGLRDVSCVMLRCTQTIDTEALCGVRYTWLSDEQVRIQFVQKWEHLIGRDIISFDLRCHHFEVFETQNIKDVTRYMKQSCEVLEELGGIVRDF
ncbi:ketoacyl-synt-domain-containing protein [Xylariaceae sp. AK1471]|nr:ketoacyl-synt-domain-containing protein [Xylariaceae sp. AK1471]